MDVVLDLILIYLVIPGKRFGLLVGLDKAQTLTLLPVFRVVGDKIVILNIIVHKVL